MRPLRVDMHGFTVFREPTTVDLTDADFYALVGPTGSGKSTVLDAICFALYGTVPRWGDRRRIENALAPSATEARVRLVFESAGARFVATRVVRRDGKGRVATTHAGLEQLPSGFDLSTFDTAPAERDAELGTVLAGTPAEMDDAVLSAVGLPYEQFTSCVVLPQGEFARFLHAKPAERQEILVNLLGLHVYQRIGVRAGLAQKQAEAASAATRSLLADLADADEAALRSALAAVAAARTLVDDVERELPALERANADGAAAQAALQRVSDEIALLSAVTAPAGIDRLGDEITGARAAAGKTEAAVHEAEEREEKLRAELAALGDRAALRRVLDLHRDRETAAGEVKKLATALKSATGKHGSALDALEQARAGYEAAASAAEAAAGEVERAQTADRAGTLRAHLVAGEPCPVCEQTVPSVPAMAAPALTAAKKHHTAATADLDRARDTVDRHDRALRELERALAAATAQHGAATQRLTTVDAELSGAPSLESARDGLAAADAAELAVRTAADAVRSARTAARAAASAARTAEDRLTGAWRAFDHARDAVAAFGPPTPDRDQLAASWRALHAWAGTAAAERDRDRDALVADAERALAGIGAIVERLRDRFGAAAVGGTDPAAYRQAAVLAVERATAAHDRVVERREQAATLTAKAAEHEREGQVAKQLALHLRADRFERWLLTEALDALVLGASHILRELSAGQYDLQHEKGEFFVVDHADAGLRRGVRTLSGGETFQASLALALALSEQLAGMSTASTSLESIILDEGFGTLDTSTLDTVAATLENLAARGDRSVGVVTHVSALAERIPVRFDVSRDGRGVARVLRRD